MIYSDRILKLIVRNSFSRDKEWQHKVKERLTTVFIGKTQEGFQTFRYKFSNNREYGVTFLSRCHPARARSLVLAHVGLLRNRYVGGCGRVQNLHEILLDIFFPLSHDLHFTIVSPLLDYIQHIHARTAKIETWSSLPPRFRKKTEEIPRVPDHSLSPLSQSSFSDFFRCCSNSGGSLVGNRKSRTTPPASIPRPQVLFSRIRCEDVIESYIHGERNNFENIYLCGLWHPEGGRFPTPR